VRLRLPSPPRAHPEDNGSGTGAAETSDHDDEGWTIVVTAEKSIVIRVSPQEFAVMRDIARCGRRDRVRRRLLDRCLRRQIRRDATMHSLNALAADPDNLCGQRGDALRHAPTVAAYAAYEHDNVFLSLGRDWWAERAIEGDLRWSPEMVAALEDEWAEARDPGGRADPLGCPRGTRVAGPSPPITGGGTGARRAMGAIVDGRKDDTGGDAV